MEGDVLAPFEPRYYWTLKIGMTVTEPRSRVRGTRCFTLLQDAFPWQYHVYAHGPVLRTRLYGSNHSRVFAEHIFYTLQVRTRTIKGFVHMKISFIYSNITILFLFISRQGAYSPGFISGFHSRGGERIVANFKRGQIQMEAGANLGFWKWWTRRLLQ